jgi:hypothetical protein
MQRSATDHVTVPRIQRCPTNWPYRSHTGPSSSSASSSRPLHRSTSTTSCPSSRLSMIVSVVPPRPAQPENGTTATVAPRRSSSSHTASRPASSRRPGRSRAACGREASRPDGVWHGSPSSALQVGHGRSRQPRATCILCAGLRRFRDEYRSCRQREPGAAQQNGHHSPSHARRSLNRCPVRRQARPESCSTGDPKPRRDRQPGPPRGPSERPHEAAPASKLDVVVCSIGPVNADSQIYWPKKTSARCPHTNLKGCVLQDFSEMARPGLEPGTPRFSVVCSTS